MIKTIVKYSHFLSKHVKSKIKWCIVWTLQSVPNIPTVFNHISIISIMILFASQSLPFGRIFIVHHYYTHILPSLRPGVEKIVYKEYYCIINYQYGYALAPKSLSQSHENYNSGEGFLNHQNYMLSLSALCPGVSIMYNMVHHGCRPPELLMWLSHGNTPLKYLTFLSQSMHAPIHPPLTHISLASQMEKFW